MADDGAACVYVRAAVLAQLERDKSELRRQLASARQQAEAGATAASASDARAADLLAILELNRSGADRALEQLRAAKNAQHRTFAASALRSLLRHLVARRLRRSLVRWRLHSRLRQLGGRLGTMDARCEVRPAVECAFAFDECFRLRFARRRELRAVAFAAWKALARQRLLKVASYRRRRARRSLAARFSSWRSSVKCRESACAVVKRLVAKHARRTLWDAWMRLRHACVRENAALWVHALDAARRAVDEERAQLTVERHEALKQAHDASERDRSHTRRFSELYSHKLAALARGDVKQRYFYTWKLHAAQAVRTRAAALRLARPHRWRRRGAFYAWKSAANRSRGLRDACRTVRARAALRMAALAFRSLATNSAVAKRQRLALKLLIRRFKTARALSRAWTRWRVGATLESQRLLATFDAQQLTDRFEIREAMLQYEVRRAAKLRQQAQLACALLKRDRCREVSGRSVVRGWGLVARVNARRRQCLQRLLGRLSDSRRRRAISRWRQRATDDSRRLAWIAGLRRQAGIRRVREIFSTWRLAFIRDRHVRFHRSIEVLRCQVSRMHRNQIRQRGVALCRLLHRKWLVDARRHTLALWKHRAEQQAQRVALATEQRSAAMMVVWTAWVRYCRNRLRTRAHQYQVVCESLVRRGQTLTRKRILFAVWHAEAARSISERLRSVDKIVSLRLGRERLTTAFTLWRHWQLDRTQRRRSLVSTLCRRRLHRIVLLYWQRWTRRTVVRAVQDAHRLASCVAEDQHRIQTLQLLSSQQRRLALIRTWEKWSTIAKTRRHTAEVVVPFIQRQGRLKLRRQCFERWRDDFVTVSRRARRALRLLLHQTRRRQTLRAFRVWQRHSTLLVARSLRESHVQASYLAEHRIASIAAAKHHARTKQRVFAAWEAFATRQRSLQRGCRRLVRRYAGTRTRIAWKHWLVLTRVTRRLDRLVMVLNRGICRLAWARLTSARLMFANEQQRARSLRFVASTWWRWQLRSGWQAWKSKTVTIGQAQLQIRQREIAASSSALMDERWLHWACQWHRRRSQRRVLHCWRAYIATQRYTTTALRTARNRRLSVIMSAWRSCTQRSKKAAQILRRLLCLVERSELRFGVVRWRLQCYDSRVASARRAVLAQVLSSPSRSSLRMLNAYRPWLVMAFAAWRSLWLRRQRQSQAFASRRSVRLTRSILRAWRRVVCVENRIVQLDRIRQRRSVSSRFYQWKQQAHQRREHLEVALERLVFSTERSLWRQGWQALRANYGRETMRRQSALAFQSAQGVIDQHRRALAMRNAALMLARRQRLDSRTLFQRWTSLVSARQHVRQLDKATSSRMARFRARAAVAKWHLGTHIKLVSRRNLQRWQKSRRRRQLQHCWHGWIAFVDDLRARKRAMTATVNAMLARSVNYHLKRAWGAWRASTVEQRELERQRRLDANNERLLLLVNSQSEVDRQHAVELQQRSLKFFAATLATVLARAQQFHNEASQARAFDHWRNSIVVVQHRIIANVVALVTARVYRSALVAWWDFARGQRAVDEANQHRQRTFERAAVLFASATTQTRKRRVMLTWKAYTLARHTKLRQRALMVATISRGLARATRRRCFRSWTRYVDTRVNQRHRVRRLDAICKRRVRRLAFHNWQHWCGAQSRLEHGVELLARLYRRRSLQLLGRRWTQWRRWLTQVAAEDDHLDDQQMLLRRVFRAWVHHFVLTSERLAALQRRRSLRALILCFSAWKRTWVRSSQLDAVTQRTPLQLFVVESSRCRAIAAATTAGLTTHRFGSYRRNRINVVDMERRRRRAWAALSILERISMTVEVRKQHQQLAVARLARSLRRQYHRVMKLALWMWLARVQTVAPSLWAANLSTTRISRTSPPPYPTLRDVDVTARVAAIVIRDLRDARAQFRQKCWRAVILAARSHRCWWLRRGFERLRTAVAVHRRTPRHSSNVASSDRSMHRKRLRAAATRALADRLYTALLRGFFREWKTQYVAAALREAEIAHDALLLALHDVTLGRQALDPLRAASPTSSYL